MLNEFILKQLEVAVKERDSLSQQLDRLTREESEENKTIQALLEREDVGVEVFSPRSSGKPVKLQVEDIRQRLEDLECQEALVREELEMTLEKEEKLRKMLSEARTTGSDDHDSSNNGDTSAIKEEFLKYRAETHEEYQILLNRINHCQEVCISDPNACKTELRTLQYYLKALLTKSEEV